MNRNEFTAKYEEIQRRIRHLTEERRQLCDEYLRNNEYYRFRDKKIQLVDNDGRALYPPFVFEKITIDDFGIVIAEGLRVKGNGAVGGKVAYWLKNGTTLVEV